MSKNFLLSKASVLILTAVVLHSLVIPAWSMEGEDEKDQNSNPAITVKDSSRADKDKNNNRNINSAQQVDGFQSLPIGIKAYILEIAAFDVGKDKKDLSNLALVCKNWNYNIVKNKNSGIKYNIKKAFWRGWYDITDSQTKEIFDQFYKGALIYRPIEGSDEGMIRLPISDLRNPLESRFDLSQCGKAGQHLNIATGYRKEKEPSNSTKLEIWVAPQFLIARNLNTTAKHFKPIMDDWKQEQAPVGIFWNLAVWEKLDWHDYLTKENMEALSSRSVYEN